MGGKSEAEVTRNEDVLVGLQGQYARLVGLVQGLGVELEEEDREPRVERQVYFALYSVSATDSIYSHWITPIRLVDADLPVPHLPRTDDQPSSEPAPHVRIQFDDADDREEMEADENEMRRANMDMMQMQKRMWAGTRYIVLSLICIPD
jgi:hypothetical protein